MIIAFKGKRPSIAPDAYIAPNATIIGDVTIGPEASVWFGAVIRGDEGKIVIGSKTNVQDNVVIHVNADSDTIIEDEVTIGHGAVLEGCHIGAGTLIGMNAVILNGAKVGVGCLIAAGAVVGEFSNIPPHMLAVGMPAKVKRPLSPEMQARLAGGPMSYVRFSQEYFDHAEIVSAGNNPI